MVRGCKHETEMRQSLKAVLMRINRTEAISRRTGFCFHLQGAFHGKKLFPGFVDVAMNLGIGLLHPYTFKSSHGDLK
jgi:hypothetical protein